MNLMKLRIGPYRAFAPFIYQFYSEKDGCATNDVSKGAESFEGTAGGGLLQTEDTSFPECSPDFQDYTPCTDPKRWKKYGLQRLTFMERHCPPPFEIMECLVPPPDGYQPPIRWPKSKSECWYMNFPYDWINKEKSNQHWLQKDGVKFLFPGGGTMFPDGVTKCVDSMVDLIPGMKDGMIRTAIDTGCRALLRNTNSRLRITMQRHRRCWTPPQWYIR
ncbi:PREDICTED: probable methyltransferase PMT20 [Ipomoea nil]|uniref:probable methyltransferase PMT20 n=1 Tax=Ipomoea nil TaxID=35883 RepID=UPI000901ED32|nr:PREDICTED: probable methyltransferase PMT20 [Ipomoea nil]